MKVAPFRMIGSGAMHSLSLSSRVALLPFVALLNFCGIATELRATDAAKMLPGTHEEVQTATETRLLEPGWWPTKGTATRDEYGGAAACARCHADKTESYAATPMAHALSPVASEKLPELTHGPLHFTIGTYSYELAQTPAGPTYSVNDGTRSLSESIKWVFGTGEIGRTYVYQQNGDINESHLSYYSGPQALDFTTGHSRSAPGALTGALGRRIANPRACFACHSTEATTNDRFDPQLLTPGVTCEGCHGPGAQHVALMSAMQDAQAPSMIFNPAKLGPVATVDFCGACHRTSVDVAFLGISGIFTLRFPAYRLQASRCWTKPDARLTCFACHDPHRPLVREPGSYDSNCLACHRNSAAAKTSSSSANHSSLRTKSSAPACPVGQKACVTCHMPQYQIPEIHATFTDHRIAIHRERSSLKR